MENYYGYLSFRDPKKGRVGFNIIGNSSSTPTVVYFNWIIGRKLFPFTKWIDIAYRANYLNYFDEQLKVRMIYYL